MCYVKEIIFELILQENNIISLMGGIFLLLYQLLFLIHGKQHETLLINNIYFTE